MDRIHFAHGNGFPSSCYRQMLSVLEKQYHCCFIDKIGHNPDYPVTDNWSLLVKELINSIELQASSPVIGVGHSLGGILSFCAAIERPDLFKSLILLDAPIIGRIKSNLLKLFKQLGMIDHVTPAHRTRGRKKTWRTKEQVLAYLLSRPLFKHFSRASLEDYIQHGMYKDSDGYRLRFDSRVEYQIYRTIPHTLYEYEGKLSVPAALIYGTDSHMVGNRDLLYMEKKYHMTCFKAPGAHMFPMEYPKQAGEAVIKAIKQISA